MYIILIVNVLLVAASVYSIVYFMSTNAMIDDIRQRAGGVTEFIMSTLSVEDVRSITENTENGENAQEKVKEVFEQLRSVGNLKRLYIAKIDARGNITATGVDETHYIPTGALERDLRKSLEESAAVWANRIYTTDSGEGIYTIFWPVNDSNGVPLGVICMEFDVDIVYQSNRNAMIYSIALSGTLIFLFFIIAFLAMSKASEPFYKRLAYTDVLTGYENRMAFEHRMRECHAIADRGETVAIIVCDVNNLKTVNDVHGHEMGDKYLKITADILFEHLPKGSPFYRIGGDEYATILVGIKEDELYDLMQRYANEHRPTVKTQPFSCACGAAIFTRGIDENMRDVFKRADEAMYVDKKRIKALLGQELR
jgi:diguanylate cyclase (GGDEF)-like protein